MTSATIESVLPSFAAAAASRLAEKAFLDDGEHKISSLPTKHTLASLIQHSKMSTDFKDVPLGHYRKKHLKLKV